MAGKKRQTVFLTRSEFPKEIIQCLEEKYVVQTYPYGKSISRDALLDGIQGVDAICVTSEERIDKEVLDASGPQLKVIATTSIGFEHIDIEECKKRNIIVCNAPNSSSVNAVAEMIIGLLLAVGRRIIESSAIIKNGEWSEYWTPTWCLGRGLFNSTVGIVGMGRIGQAVLKRLLAFDVTTIVYFDVCQPIREAEILGAKYMPFEALLHCSDFVIATCNLTPQSKNLFNAKAFNCMKSSAIFINASRGGIVEQDDLYDALMSGIIKGAALDVMYPEPLPKDHKLVSLPNIVLLPHISSADELAVNKIINLAVQNIIQVLEGKTPLTPVT